MNKNLRSYDNIIKFIKDEILYNGEDNRTDNKICNIKRSDISMDFILKCLDEYKKIYPKFLFDRELLNKLHNNEDILNYFNHHIGIFGRESFDGDGSGYILGYYNNHDINNIEPHPNLSPDENLYRLILNLKETKGNNNE